MTMLIRLAETIDRANRHAGRIVSWVVIALVMTQFAVVVARHVFAIGFPAAQEAIWYMYGLVFMIGAGHTLLIDGHVRLDLFYRDAGMRTQALVDLLGAILLLVPFCATVFAFAWPYVVQSWSVLEGSTESGGLPLVFAYKTVILVFAVLLGAQGVAMAIRAARFLAGGQGGYGPPGRATGRATGF